MKKIILILMIMGIVSAYEFPSATNTFSASTLAKSSEVNANFTDMVNGFSGSNKISAKEYYIDNAGVDTRVIDNDRDVEARQGTFSQTLIVSGATSLNNNVSVTGSLSAVDITDTGTTTLADADIADGDITDATITTADIGYAEVDELVIDQITIITMDSATDVDITIAPGGTGQTAINDLKANDTVEMFTGYYSGWVTDNVYTASSDCIIWGSWTTAAEGKQLLIKIGGGIRATHYTAGTVPHTSFAFACPKGQSWEIEPNDLGTILINVTELGR